MALVMPAVVVDLVMLAVELRSEVGEAITASLTSPTSTWAVNVNNVCDKRGETQRRGGIYRYYSVRNCGEVGSSYDTYGSIGDERRDPINALSQLLASLLAAPHLPELERPQDDGPLLEEQPKLL